MRQKLFTIVLLMSPGLAWGPEVQVNEPGALPLVAAAGAVAIAIQYIRRRK